jgi:predicted N-formylglutamate amidohydrolase
MNKSGIPVEPEHSPGLLGKNDGPPYELLNPDGRAALLLVCDHASNTIPQNLGTLGLSEDQLNLHIAIDIGAGAVTRQLSQRFDAPAVLAGYSRLVVDVNRRLEETTAFPDESDGILVPGNIGIDVAERNARIRECYTPYHDAIAAQLDGFNSNGVVPAFIAIHSFTPIMSEEKRPWEIGILWDKDSRLSDPLIRLLSDEYGLCVGDNLPYSGRHPADFTVDHHAESAGLAHVGIEIRHDLIRDTVGVDRLAGLLGNCIEVVLRDESLYHTLGSVDIPGACRT